MPRDADHQVTQSLLDRLTDLEPRTPADVSVTRAQSVRDLKKALRRDLEWLFNSRATANVPADYAEVSKSIMNYGLPDVANLSMANAKDRTRLQRSMESAIARFEPRLANIHVRLIDAGTEGGKAVRFQIDGLLKMDPVPERISFDTVLDVVSGDYSIKGEAGAG